MEVVQPSRPVEILKVPVRGTRARKPDEKAAAASTLAPVAAAEAAAAKKPAEASAVKPGTQPSLDTLRAELAASQAKGWNRSAADRVRERELERLIAAGGAQAEDKPVKTPAAEAEGLQKTSTKAPVSGAAKPEAAVSGKTPEAAAAPVPDAIQKLIQTGKINETDLPQLQGKDGRYLTGRMLQTRMNKLGQERRDVNKQAAAEKRRPTKAQKDQQKTAEEAERQRQADVEQFITSYAPESVEVNLAAGRDAETVADDVLDQYDHNTSLALRVIRSQSRRLTDFRDQAASLDTDTSGYDKKRLTIRERSIHYEAVAVADAYGELHDAKTAREDWRKKQDKLLSKAGLSKGDSKAFGARLAVLQEMRKPAAERNMQTVTDNLAKARLDHAGQNGDMDKVLAQLEGVETDGFYLMYLAAYDPVYPTRYPDQQVFTDSRGRDITLTNCRSHNEAIAQAQSSVRNAEYEVKGYEMLKARGVKLSEQAQEYDRQITELNELAGYLVGNEYKPNRGNLIADYTQLEARRKYRDDLKAAKAVFEGRGLKGNEANSTLAYDGKEIKEQEDAIKESVDTTARVESFGVVQRGLELAKRIRENGMDINAVKIEDRVAVILAQTLTGQEVYADLHFVIQEGAGQPTPKPPEPTPPAAPKPPEEPVPAPPAEAKSFGKLTGAELNALGYDGIAAVAGELSPQQVADLPLGTRLKLIREGKISDKQYSKVPEDIKIVKQVDALLQMSDDEMKQAIESLRKQAETDSRTREQLLFMEEELRAQLSGVYSDDERKISKNDADRRADLEAKAKSPDSNIAGRAKGALKVLAAAGLIAMMSTTGGGEEH